VRFDRGEPRQWSWLSSAHREYMLPDVPKAHRLPLPPIGPKEELIAQLKAQIDQAYERMMRRAWVDIERRYKS
jgi:hypothetical protein